MRTLRPQLRTSDLRGDGEALRRGDGEALRRGVGERRLAVTVWREPDTEALRVCRVCRPIDPENGPPQCRYISYMECVGYVDPLPPFEKVMCSTLRCRLCRRRDGP